MRAHPALVLNADFQPLNYFPLSTMDWETAVKTSTKAICLLSLNTTPSCAVHRPRCGCRALSQCATSCRFRSALRSRVSTCSCGIGFVASIAASGSPPINSRSITSSHAHLVAQRNGRTSWRPAILAICASPIDSTCGLCARRSNRHRSSSSLPSGCSRPTTCTKVG